MKSPRNKTLELLPGEKEKYLNKCIPADKRLTLSEITDGIINADFFDAVKLLPGAFADLVIADPPYNLEKVYDGTVFRRMSDSEYRSYTERWITDVKSVMKPEASIYICCDWRSGMIIGDVLEKHFKLRNRITWEREKGRGAAENWKNSMEDIWFATVSDKYTFNLDAVKIRKKVIAPYRAEGKPKDWEETPEGNFRNTCPSNFWDDISVPYWSMPENTPHPTQKPEKLLAKLILAGSNEGDTVFDPFSGSGSTAVTAKKLGRHYTGIEISGEYCAWAQKRLENAGNDKTIQGYADGVFWERNTAEEQKKARQKNEK